MEIKKKTPFGKLTPVEARAEELSGKPVGRLTLVTASTAAKASTQEIDTRDTDTFTAFMEENEAAVEKVEEPEMETQVSELLRPHLQQAEGERLEVYQGQKDKEGVLTAGIGHRLTPKELKKLSKGDPVTPEQVQAWYEEDSKKAVGAAVKQSKELGVENPEFMSALASVNFQLGVNWKREHKQTWKLMKEGKFFEAAEEAANSAWNTQTPERVEAFQEALLDVAKEREFSGLEDGWYRDRETREEFQIVDGRRV